MGESNSLYNAKNVKNALQIIMSDATPFPSLHATRHYPHKLKTRDVYSYAMRRVLLFIRGNALLLLRVAALP